MSIALSWWNPDMIALWLPETVGCWFSRCFSSLRRGISVHRVIKCLEGKWKVKVKSLSCVRLSDPMDCSLPWDFPGKSTEVGCHFLLQGIFPTQGSNPGLLHCRRFTVWATPTINLCQQLQLVSCVCGVAGGSERVMGLSTGLWRIGLVNFEYKHLPSWKKKTVLQNLLHVFNNVLFLLLDGQLQTCSADFLLGTTLPSHVVFCKHSVFLVPLCFPWSY